MGHSVDGHRVDHWLVALAVFAVLRGVAWALKLVMPGQWAVGIASRAHSDSGPAHPEEGTVVDGDGRHIACAGGVEEYGPVESGASGTEPLLGLASPEWIATAAITILGGLNVMAGLLILRTRLVGAVIGFGVLGAEVLAAMIHRNEFRDWAGQAVIARRELQGLPLREGEVEMMKTTATVLPAVIAAGVIWLLVVAVRFRTNGRLTSHAADDVAGR